jgi:hypothetical protein
MLYPLSYKRLGKPLLYTRSQTIPRAAWVSGLLAIDFLPVFGIGKLHYSTTLLRLFCTVMQGNYDNNRQRLSGKAIH